jgi:enoyl-CoA hydratase
MERTLFHACFSEHDFREGLTAFTEKRKPRFEHR